MKLVCPKCGNTTEFLASQACRGTIQVVVDAKGDFMCNTTADYHIDASGLDFDDPTGPYYCRKCGCEVAAD